MAARFGAAMPFGMEGLQQPRVPAMAFLQSVIP